jgi:hypothetical protein
VAELQSRAPFSLDLVTLAPPRLLRRAYPIWGVVTNRGRGDPAHVRFSMEKAWSVEGSGPITSSREVGVRIGTSLTLIPVGMKIRLDRTFVSDDVSREDVTYPGSSNWSGPSVVYSGTPFAVEAIEGEFVVPTARQAFGSCTGGWDYSSQWPGIDGNGGSGDVLQAGTEADAYCNGNTTSSFYSAWIEWFPFSETRVGSPAIHPGDLVFVEVWNVSPTAGYAYFYNFSTQTAAEYALSAPSGTHLVGNSLEWIVERPSVGGSLATLTNYTDVSWPLGVAWNYQAANPTYFFPGEALSVPAPYNLELLTMVDNSGHGISYGSPQNFGFVYFEDYGSANGGNVAPYY